MDSSVTGVGVLDKAISILDAVEHGPCSLPDLIAATGLPRATAHRLALALTTHGLLGRDGDGRFVLGPRFTAARVADAARPALEALRDATGESVQLYVRRGARRLCVVSLDSPNELRTSVPVGALLPLDRGSAGAVLRGVPEVLRRGWAESVAERAPGVASVSAPVHAGGAPVAAVCLSGPIERVTASPGARFAAAVVTAARRIERAAAPSAALSNS
ncbi:MAG TPA: helix-turn-helix domain-containing protein [Chloroflexota bacterium]|nr:helix-turn-helix domain-containing protein [Chloroflexota bacterium]